MKESVSVSTRGRSTPRDRHQRLQAGPLRAGEGVEAAADERAVGAESGAMSTTVPRPRGRGSARRGRAAAGSRRAPAARGRRAPATAQIDGGVRRRRQLRVDDRQRRRQLRQRQVVVDDDDVHAQRARVRHLVEGAGAAVDGDEQRGALLVEPAYRRAVQAVPLAEAVGDVGDDARAQRAQRLR